MLPYKISEVTAVREVRLKHGMFKNLHIKSENAVSHNEQPVVDPVFFKRSTTNKIVTSRIVVEREKHCGFVCYHKQNINKIMICDL